MRRREEYIYNFRRANLPLIIQRQPSPGRVDLDSTGRPQDFTDRLSAAALLSTSQVFLSPEKGSKMIVFGEENESEF
ncbi:hypothetical protein [Collimonas fungivorans]|uniref:hypothetical protein n=1 Tax=Collimonas fungivorans TaxID=158899 RepID=UPI0012370EE7|nr:hypothetical protein [Collimonas fungivorans]